MNHLRVKKFRNFLSTNKKYIEDTYLKWQETGKLTTETKEMNLEEKSASLDSCQNHHLLP